MIHTYSYSTQYKQQCGSLGVRSSLIPMPRCLLKSSTSSSLQQSFTESTLGAAASPRTSRSGRRDWGRPFSNHLRRASRAAMGLDLSIRQDRPLGEYVHKRFLRCHAPKLLYGKDLNLDCPSAPAVGFHMPSCQTQSSYEWRQYPSNPRQTLPSTVA